MRTNMKVTTGEVLFHFVRPDLMEGASVAIVNNVYRDYTTMITDNKDAFIEHLENSRASRPCGDDDCVSIMYNGKLIAHAFRYIGSWTILTSDGNV